MDEKPRAWAREHKRESGGCTRCRVDDSVYLDFHHTEEKTKAVSKLVVAKRPLKEIEREVEKCVLLCANYHRIEHHEDRAPKG